ncbi:MAG: T9SS type A sorting domain-containing protein [Bacteroidota bacterium]
MKKLVFLLFTSLLFLQFISFSSTQAQPAFPFFDDVEDSATTYANWDRDSSYWDIRITNAHSGQQVWALTPGFTDNYNFLTLSSPIDLSSASNPYIAFWIKTNDNNSGYVKVDISTDGGSTWTQLGNPSFSGALFTRFQFSLENYKQANILLRIGGYRYNRTYYVDDILIDNAPTPTYIIQSNPTNNGMKLTWGQSTAADFDKYKIVLSTAANKINFGAASYIYRREEVKAFEIYSKTTLDTVLTDLAFTNTKYYAKIYEQDNQDLINQGSEVNDLSTIFDLTMLTAPFTETFEGSSKLAADIPWAVTTADTDTGHSASHAYEDSPGGNYPAEANRHLVMKVDLSSVERPILKFNQKYSFEAMRDFGYVNVSIDNHNWTNITGSTGNSGGVWKPIELDIGVLKQQSSGYIMFQTVSNANTQRDGWHIDDIEIVNNNKTTSFPFFDDVEDETFSHDSWIDGFYHPQITNAHSGQNVWEIKAAGGQYNYLTLAGTLNLYSAPNPYLSFWVKRSDGASGYVDIQVSDDGGQSWKRLANPNFTGNSFTRFQVSLFDYRRDNILVRIGTYSPYNTTYFIDDILIDNAPTPQSFILSEPTNNGMKLTWGQSTAADFDKYKIVLSTAANKINFYATSYIYRREEVKVFEVFSKSTVDTVITDLAFTNTKYYGKIYEQDTQELINQGSELSDLSTIFDVITETAPFIETFDDSYKWAQDIPWMVTTADSADSGHTAPHAYEDSPGGKYPANADRYLRFLVNLEAVERPVLRFNHKYSFEQMRDFGNVYISPNNVNWTKLAGFTYHTSDKWETRKFDVGTLKQQNGGYILFQSYTNANTEQDGWHIDDVEIYDNKTKLGFPVVDSVEIDSVSHVLWINGQWDIMTTNALSGQQVWALEPTSLDYPFLTLAAPLNLTDAPKPYLSFWIKREDGATGYALIDVSDDGGLTWKRIANPSFSGNAYVNLTYSLADYKELEILVRIGAYAPYNKTYLLDDITIADSTGYSYIVGVDNITGIVPEEYELSQNYPNPFNPSTTIRYALPTESKVSILIYNTLGQKLATLVNTNKAAGNHEIVFNANNLPSGVYFYNIMAHSSDGKKEYINTKKLLLLK